MRLRKEADLLTPSVEELIRRAAGVRKPKPARESLAESTDSPAFPRTSLDSRPPTSHPKQFFNGWGEKVGLLAQSHMGAACLEGQLKPQESETDHAAS